MEGNHHPEGRASDAGRNEREGGFPFSGEAGPPAHADVLEVSDAFPGLGALHDELPSVPVDFLPGWGDLEAIGESDPSLNLPTSFMPARGRFVSNDEHQQIPPGGTPQQGGVFPNQATGTSPPTRGISGSAFPGSDLQELLAGGPIEEDEHLQHLMHDWRPPQDDCVLWAPDTGDPSHASALRSRSVPAAALHDAAAVNEWSGQPTSGSELCTSRDDSAGPATTHSADKPPANLRLPRVRIPAEILSPSLRDHRRGDATSDRPSLTSPCSTPRGLPSGAEAPRPPSSRGARAARTSRASSRSRPSSRASSGGAGALGRRRSHPGVASTAISPAISKPPLRTSRGRPASASGARTSARVSSGSLDLGAEVSPRPLASPGEITEEMLELYPSLRANRNRGGRKVAPDPRLDPNIDPKKAERTMRNRIAAAKSKAKKREENELMQARNDRLEECTAALARRCDSIWEQSSELEQTLEQMMQRIAALRAEKEALTREKAALEGRVDSLPAVLCPAGPQQGDSATAR